MVHERAMTQRFWDVSDSRPFVYSGNKAIDIRSHRLCITFPNLYMLLTYVSKEKANLRGIANQHQGKLMLILDGFCKRHPTVCPVALCLGILAFQVTYADIICTTTKVIHTKKSKQIGT